MRYARGGAGRPKVRPMRHRTGRSRVVRSALLRPSRRIDTSAGCGDILHLASISPLSPTTYHDQTSRSRFMISTQESQNPMSHSTMSRADTLCSMSKSMIDLFLTCIGY